MQSEFFDVRYGKLNPAQKRAVDDIYGPMLVLAGPGTGKTELLSLRVANILKLSDADPGNILCLTFTESAQNTMQARLTKLIGPRASQVAVHTFHSFGSHIIGTHGDYFKEAFGFRPSDDVTRYQLVADVLEHLPRDIKLGGLYDGEFFYLRDIQQRISQLKQGGISPDVLAERLMVDVLWTQQAAQPLSESLDGMSRITAKEISKFEALQSALPEPGESPLSLSAMLVADLERALEAADGKQTKPVTAWKTRWLTKDGQGKFIFKAAKQLQLMTELLSVYEAYQNSLASRRLYDYDDMIMRVIEGLQTIPDLRAELQEQYQYILVDEYQDTNGAQLQMLELLAEHPVNEQQPNLLVVGDDDQAIYGFQGAYQSNVIDFLSRWPKAKTEVLTVNYRATTPLLEFARQLIVQGEDRLENRRPEFSKILTADSKDKGHRPHIESLPTEVEQFSWLADQIKALIEDDNNAQQIAVIAPKHSYLEQLVPYLQDRGVAVAYDRREDVLQQPHISQLLTLARVIVHLADGEISLANQSLPELLSYPWWGIDPGWLWELSLAAHQQRKPWLELLRDSPHKRLQQLATWLLTQAKASASTPLEPMMDNLIGPAEPGRDFSSPYRQFYFGHNTVQDSVNYLRLLSGLVSLRTALRQYQPDSALQLADFVRFADLRSAARLPLRNDHPLVLDTTAVQLLSVHKAKGLEFDHVFLINVDEHAWNRDRGRSNKIGLPPNYAPLAPSGDTSDEKLRVLYVAATRARERLTLCNFLTTQDGTPVVPLGWLQTDPVQQTFERVTKHQAVSSQQLTRELGFDWLTPHFDIRTKAPWRALLQQDMERYQLSATHLNAFLDVSRGGPKAFLVNQLLRFPQALSVNAQFGNAMHAIMQKLHLHFNQFSELPPQATAIEWLNDIIADYYFGPIEEPKAQRRGALSLDAIYAQLPQTFQVGQMAEYDFAGEGVVLGTARLKGKLDRLELDKATHTALIADYKTGSGLDKWLPSELKSFAAYKSHRYQQQLGFYKLLVEGSRSFRGYQANSGSLVFLEADESGQLRQLELSYETAAIDRLKRLIAVVYDHIVRLDLPDTSHYTPDFQGNMAFEAELLGETPHQN